MRLLEHQAKRLLTEFGLVFSDAVVATTASEAAAAAEKIGGPVVVKAQVPFGGRGKAGAVRFAQDPSEAGAHASALLGRELRGELVVSVTVEPKISFKREFYVGVAWDTASKLPIALLSDAGGIDIESVGRIVRRNFDPWRGLDAFAGREMASALEVRGKIMVQLGEMLGRLSSAFLKMDALTVEINPLVETMDGILLGLDSHLELDDDALVRHQPMLGRIGEKRSGNAVGRAPTALEIEAQRIDAMDHRGVAGRVVEFDGDLGLLIGGGGASLTVFDAIRRHQGRPANYCEVGGNPTEEKVAALTSLILAKPGVRHLAVIMNVVNNTRADVMAKGVITGIKRVGRKPAEVLRVFRIPGSWEGEARDLLSVEGVVALGRDVSLDEAARLAVERSRRNAD